jgi:hypothetical protein
MGSDGDQCYFDPADGLKSPYAYFFANGTQMSKGHLHNGACIFDGAACSPGLAPRAPNGSFFQCCKMSEDLNSQNKITWLIPFAAFMVPCYGLQILDKVMKRKKAAKRKAALLAVAGGQPPSDAPARAPGGEETPEASTSGSPDNAMKAIMEQMSPLQVKLMHLLFWASIAALIAESTIMPLQIQTRLTPADRSAQLAMTSFLTPIAEVFAFLEDSMTVQVGYAIARNDHSQLNALLQISIWGGAACGLAAFLLMLAFSTSESSAAALLNPSNGPNAALIAAGCDLVPTTEELLGSARVYWLLTASTWVPQFMSKGVAGFLLGTFQVPSYLFPLVVQASVPIGLWFGLLPLTETTEEQQPGGSGEGGHVWKPITVLAVAYSVGPWLIGAFQLAYLYGNKSLRQRYGIACGSMTRARRALHSASAASIGEAGLPQQQQQQQEADDAATLRGVVKEGLMLMAVDLAVQLSITITIYVAAHHEFEAVYKLGALQSAYWVWGPNYLVGTMLIFKMAGAQLVASGKYAIFVRMTGVATFFVMCLFVAAIVGGLLKHESLALAYGESACVFGAKHACAPVYADLFEGSDSLQTTFESFGPVVAFQLLFMVTRAALTTCRDFAFMAKAATATLALVFTPALLVAHYAVGTATAYYVAMYAPHFAMGAVFLWRLRKNFASMLAGGRGTWSEVEAKVKVARSVSTLRAVEMDITDGQAAGGATTSTGNPAYGGEETSTSGLGRRQAWTAAACLAVAAAAVAATAAAAVGPA